MCLKFIGKNGSMGLVFGRVYDVKIVSDSRYIWVKWGNKQCPYSSPQALASNWRTID